MAFEKVGDYISIARTLLNDIDNSVYRYTDQLMFTGLQTGVDDMRRLRPDLFLADMTGQTVIADATTDLTVIDPSYRSALLYYLVGYCELVDDEASDKARAASFTSLFSAKLTGATV